jgi:hypothetical protein
MCLSTVMTDKEMKKEVATIPREGIVVYKMVQVGKEVYMTVIKNGVKNLVVDNRYYPVFFGNDPYKEGVNKACTEHKPWTSHQTQTDIIDGVKYIRNVTYESGFHFYKTKSAAKSHLKGLTECNTRDYCHPCSRYTVIECIVKKSWITAIGTENILKQSEDVIVAKKAIFPKAA